MNLHQNNVGNQGDILKHAALKALAGLLADPRAGTLNYLDTHAYLLYGRLANRLWRAETERLAVEHPGYRGYVEVEAPWVARGQYQCSAGIVHGVAPHAQLYLSESDATTRTILTHQIADAGMERVTLLSAAAQWCDAPPAARQGRLLALLDPFCLTEDDWRAGLCGLERLHRGGEDGLLEVFTYDKQVSEVDWPPPPEGWAGPLARVHRAPFHLAVYASGPIRRSAARSLQGLGWRR